MMILYSSNLNVSQRHVQLKTEVVVVRKWINKVKWILWLDKSETLTRYVSMTLQEGIRIYSFPHFNGVSHGTSDMQNLLWQTLPEEKK